MGPKRQHQPIYVEDDSLSEELEDISEDVINLPLPKKPKAELRVARPTDLQWTEKYEPQCPSDVCINPRKAKEILEALYSMVKHELPTRILVLTGPSGCSKSTMIKCLAKEILRERIAKAPEPWMAENTGVVEYLESEILDVPQPTQFSDFLDGCRYRVGANLAVVLIEELPNVFHPETLAALRQKLSEWIYADAELPPVVLCLTEVELASEHRGRGYYNIENNLTMETLLGMDLCQRGAASGRIVRIKMLPVAKTFMKKTLGRIAEKERLRIPARMTDAVFLPMYEGGDIRSLICNLQFWALLPLFMTQTTAVRASHLALFHAVGKVIHSSSKFASLEDDASDQQSIQSVVDGYHNIGLLHLAMLENYAIYNGLQFDVAVAARLVNNLSINDTFPEEAQDFGLRAVRSELRLVEEVSGRTQPMKFPRHFKMVREANKVRREIQQYVRYGGGSHVLFDTANLYDGCLLPAIYNSFGYKFRHGAKAYDYNRLGGGFKAVYADHDLPVLESEREAAVGEMDQFHADIAARMAEEHMEDEEELSEEIEESDGDLDDTLDSRLIALTQKDLDDEFLDDPQLDMLVSQGRL